MPNFDLEGIRFVTYGHYSPPPEEVWEPLYDVHAQAFNDALKDVRTPEEIANYVGDIEHFRDTTLNPQLMVGDRHNANQEYHRPRLIVASAFEGAQPVGFIRTASNASGDSWPERLYKRVRVVKNYRPAIELAVDPGFQHRGIALALIFGGFETALPGQTGTGYVSKADLPKVVAMAEWLAGVDTGPGEPRHDYFGEGHDPVVLNRYAFKTARRAAQRMLDNVPGFSGAIAPYMSTLERHTWAGRLLLPIANSRARHE